VDSICSALAAKNIDIHRDKADLNSGDRIKEFMDRLIEGDLIVAVLSDKYLRSPFCMYELFGIFRRCRDRADGFLDHVIPIVLPDAKIARAVDRLKYAAFWKQERDELEQAIRGSGRRGLRGRGDYQRVPPGGRVRAQRGRHAGLPERQADAPGSEPGWRTTASPRSSA
jgi:hypothetical protein